MAESVEQVRILLEKLRQKGRLIEYRDQSICATACD
jgi:hypothetical protein